MGLFDILFNRSDRGIQELMNPALAMKLREFVIVDDDPNYVKHYFKFRNKEGEDEEFITVYGRAYSQLDYLHTMLRRAAWAPDFKTLSESGPWSMTITYLIEQGQRLSPNTRPTLGHFASKIGPITLPQPTKPDARRVTQPKGAETPSAVDVDAIRASFSNKVRKHPKDYAVWMYEPNPSEFVVLLVKLDSDGNMAGSWSLGSFHSRKEQGAFALEVARDFQISLNDVVPTSRQDSTGSTSDTPADKPSGGVSPSIECTKWQVARGDSGIEGPRPSAELSRTYRLSGLAPPHKNATLRIVCMLESEGLDGGLESETGRLRLHRKLSFYFQPFWLPHEAAFVMGLSAVDQSRGGEFDVIASPVDRDTSVIAKFGGRNDVRTCLDVLTSGCDMIFTISNETESLVKLRLPSDGEFKQLVDDASNKLAETEVFYELLRSQSRR